MSENPNPKPNPDLPLEETQAATPTASAQPASVTGVTTDVTTDFDESDSAPSSSRLGLFGSAPRTPATNQMVADYRLEKKLGEGGMGRVFKALDPQGRAVAIKLLSQHLTCSDEALQRFKQEGYIASQINHPHCVFVHRVDEDRGTPFIAMELMTGKTLKDMVQHGGRLPYKEAVRLILQCIDGLIEAHRLGMIHRDIKPANCYLDEEGNVKIGDFGLARSLVDDSELTRTGAFLGTPLFASPEQLLGQKIDERSDIYSLSATLYYLLAGRAPFESPNAAQVIAKIASSDPPSLKDNDVNAPPALEAVLMRGLARDVNKRFESFQKMRAALLPLTEPDREIASLPRRAVAAFLDLSIFSVLFRLAVVGVTSLIGLSLNQLPHWLPYLSLVGWFVYLWLFEWLLGWTIGKRIVKLKVVDSQLGMRQSAIKLLMRTGIFVLAMESIRILNHMFFVQPGDNGSALATSISFVVGVAVIMAAWRRSGKRQLTHEWYSQTETCLAMPERAAVTAELDLPEWTLPMIGQPTCPLELGRFAIKGQLKTRQADQWLLAHDVNLEREVWIHWLPSGAPPITTERKNCNLRTRMRVIESGIEQKRHWDAFLAPEGIPLSVFIQHGSHLPWPIAHHLMEQLVSDCDLPRDQIQSDDPWNVHRYWLDRAGRLTLAEADVELSASAGQNTPEDLLQQVALAALPPKHSLRRKKHLVQLPQPITGDVSDLPSYAGLRLLERVADKRLTLPQLKNELEVVNRTADQVTPSMRFVHAATVTLMVSPLLVVIMIVLLMNTVMLMEKRFRHSQLLATVSHVQRFPEKYPTAWEGLTEQDKTLWLAPEKISQVKKSLQEKQSEMQVAYAHCNPIERMVFNALEINETSIHSDMMPSDMVSSDRPSGTSTVSDAEQAGKSVQVQAPVEIRIGGLLKKSESLVGLVASVASKDELWQPVRLPEDQRETFGWILLCPLVVVTIWTGLTRGGLAQMLTGVTAVRRDGCRIGWMRAWWRSAFLFAPYAILTWIIIQLEANSVQWMWLTLQLKIALCFLPAFYLVGALVWPQAAPHDKLCGTAVVPR